VDTPVKRDALARNFLGTFQAEAKEAGTHAPAAAVQGVDSRAPFFFRPFSLAGPILRPLPVLERISAYRVLSSLSALLLFCVGAFLLQRAGLDAGVVLSYGLIWLVPYMVFAVASISNYATAIGLGSMLAACALVLILSEKRPERAASAGLLVAGCWIAIPVWTDFILLAPIATTVVTLGVVGAVTRKTRPITRWTLLTASATFMTGIFVLFALVASRAKIGNVGTRMPAALPKSLDWNVFWMAVAVAAPLAVASLLALAVRWLLRLSSERSPRIAVGASVTLGLLLVAGFFLTPWTLIPYETERYWYSKLVREHFKVFFSNSLAWDQDMLSWKFYVGAGGWHDLFLPDAIYAASRWLSVAVLICLPSLILNGFNTNRHQRTHLFLLSGLAALLSIVTLTIRYLGPGIPWGRFALPWWPLVALPLVTIACSRRVKLLAAIVSTAVLLHLWTAIVLVGTRYLFGQS
jgi:hypothetical protein